MEIENWWKGAVIYQIYPRSFQDSNDDGIGDLNGITSRLGYVADLGVDAVWISPFFTSPMLDFGYDIADYQNVDPIFGCLKDFERLIEQAHQLGLRVMIDQVLSHSSDQHHWFSKSRQDRSNDKADWYVWVDPKPDGSPPNNWLSMFGGVAWTWDSRRKQYYLHSFLSSQPDLNFHNPQVRQAQLDNVRFWLEMGVDGIRLDVVNFYYHDQQLRDNPPITAGSASFAGASPDSPYAYQQHVYDNSQVDNLSFLRELRRLLDDYPGRASLGEIAAQQPIELMSQYTSGDDKLNMAYTFDLLGKESSAEFIRNVIQRTEQKIADGWPCWAISNHDVERCVSRWDKSDSAASFARVILALVLSMRGSVCLYQGDELGLPQAQVPFDRLQDPYGRPFWPNYKGRDGCRTPMIWDDRQPFAGFSSVEPWLPIDRQQLTLAVAKQQPAGNSTLNFARQFVQWRKQFPALINGEIELATKSGDALCWLRKKEGEKTVFTAFNLTAKTVDLEIPATRFTPLEGHGFQGPIINNGTFALQPCQAMFAEPLS